MAISPLDVVKIRLQLQPEPLTLKGMLSLNGRNHMKYHGITQTFKKIIMEEGVKVCPLLFFFFTLETHFLFFLYIRDYLKEMLLPNIYMLRMVQHNFMLIIIWIHF